jgi:hypothetical protein
VEGFNTFRLLQQAPLHRQFPVHSNASSRGVWGVRRTSDLLVGQCQRSAHRDLGDNFLTNGVEVRTGHRMVDQADLCRSAGSVSKPK